jgi:hypothetical protein
MMRTLPFGKVDLDSTLERADGHDFDDGEAVDPPAHFPGGTPWPSAGIPSEVGAIGSGARGLRRAAAPPPFLEDDEGFDDDFDDDDLADPPAPLASAAIHLEELEIDIATRTLMGVGARAVRSVAKSGWVEARLARRGPQATPEGPSGPSMPPDINLSVSPRVHLSPSAAPVQPPHLSREELPLAPADAADVPAFSARMTLPADSPEARLISALVSSPDARRIAPAVDPAALVTLYVRGPARANGSRPSISGYRVLGVALLAVAVAALAAYIATTLFYAFSTSWVTPAVVSPSDDKVVSLQSGLAAQQHQRDRIAAELEETARTVAAQRDPRSDVARQAGAHREVLEASIARQDEIIRGLEQSPYLRAIADRAQVALVPYDNLDRAAPGTKVVACRVAMVMCREVGRVIEVLPGEVAFKHPRREKMMRGQMIELELADPAATARDVLFLGGAPLGF